MTPLDVLIVDDEPKVCRLLKEILAARGCTVRTAHDGLERDEALRLADQFKKPEIGMALVLVDDQPGLSCEIVLGGRLLREYADVKPTKADRIATVSEVVRNLFTPEAAVRACSVTSCTRSKTDSAAASSRRSLGRFSARSSRRPSS